MSKLLLKILSLLIFASPLLAQQDSIKLISNINPDGGLNPANFIEYAGKMFFSGAHPIYGNELFSLRNDHISFVVDINKAYDSYPHDFAVFQNNLYFGAIDTSDGDELWSYNNNDGIALLVKNGIAPRKISSHPSGLIVYKNNLYFCADDAPVWNNANQVYIYNYDLFKFDGDSLSKIAENISDQAFLYPTIFNDTLFFRTRDSLHGTELWYSTGDRASLAYDLLPGSQSSSPQELKVFNNKLYFTCYDDSHGRELWVYDGKNKPTLVGDEIYTGPNGSEPLELTDFENKLFFAAYDLAHGYELWNYDGKSFNLIKDINPGDMNSMPNSLTVFNNKLYFFADDNTHGQELWVYDGKTTSMVCDLNPGSNYGVEPDNGMFVYDNKLYFCGSSEGTIDQLYALIPDTTTVIKKEPLQIIPNKYSLSQNYPNPFNPTTTIQYTVSAQDLTSQRICLTVYNTLGKKVATLVNKEQKPGNYLVIFDGSQLPSGVYFFTLTAGKFSATKKMILIK